MNTPPLPAEDIDRIMEVMGLAFDPAYGEAWTRRQVSDAMLMDHCHWAVIGPDGRRPAGSEPAAGFYLSRMTLDEEELLLLAVRPEMRRRGIGRQLIQYFINSSIERGVKRILLEMREGNPAEILYRNCGFRPIGRRPKYYAGPGGSRLDAITFERIIHTMGSGE